MVLERVLRSVAHWTVREAVVLFPVGVTVAAMADDRAAADLIDAFDGNQRHGQVAHRTRHGWRGRMVVLPFGQLGVPLVLRGPLLAVGPVLLSVRLLACRAALPHVPASRAELEGGLGLALAAGGALFGCHGGLQVEVGLKRMRSPTLFPYFSSPPY